MTLDALLQFLRHEIRMSHIYQPLLVRTLLDNGGYCTRRQLALALLMHDESQIEYYEKRLRDMPLPVLKRRGVISESDGIVRLEVDKLSLQDRASIRLECDSLIQKFIAQRGIRIWDHRMMHTRGGDAGVVPCYIGKAETIGKTSGVLSANLMRLTTDTSKFGHWGDNYAYHIGDLSSVVLTGHDATVQTEKYRSWATAPLRRNQHRSPAVTPASILLDQGLEKG